MNCQSCSTANTYIVQYRKNKSGQKPIWRCRTCKHRFVTCHKNYRHSKHLIDTVIRLRSAGYSLSQVKQSLEQNFRVNVSRTTIQSWDKTFN